MIITLPVLLSIFSLSPVPLPLPTNAITPLLILTRLYQFNFRKTRNLNLRLNFQKFTAIVAAAVEVGCVRKGSVVSVGKNAADLGSADGLRSSPRSSCSYWHIYTSCPAATGANHRQPWRHTTSPNLAIWQQYTERLLSKNQTVWDENELMSSRKKFYFQFRQKAISICVFTAK